LQQKLTGLKLSVLTFWGKSENIHVTIYSIEGPHENYPILCMAYHPKKENIIAIAGKGKMFSIWKKKDYLQKSGFLCLLKIP